MITCKFCVAKYGFKVSDKDRMFNTDEELGNHMEDCHGIPVIRKGETAEQAMERCAKKGIVEDKNKCQCQDCREERKKNIASSKLANLIADNKDVFVNAENASFDPIERYKDSYVISNDDVIAEIVENNEVK